MASKQPQKGKSKGRKRFILAGIAILLLLSVIFIPQILIGNRASAVAGNLTTYEAARRNITVTLSGSGTLQPADSYTIKALVEGDILSAPFEEGEVVKKDTVLYKVDSSDVSSGIAQAENSLAQSRNNYEQKVKTQDNLNIKSNAAGTVVELDVDAGDTVQAGQTIAVIRNVDVMSITLPFLSQYAAGFQKGQGATVLINGSGEILKGTVSKVGSTDRVLDGNSMTREVTIDVANPGALSKSQAASASVGGVESSDIGTFTYKEEKTVAAAVSGKVSELKVKEGDRVEKNRLLVVLASDTMDADLKNSSLSLKDAELSLQTKKNQLDNYTITSPIAGTIVEKSYKEGDTLKAGEALCTIFDLSSLKLVLNVDELDIGKVKTGQTVKITANSTGSSDIREYKGIVTKININGTTVNGVTSYPVTIRIDNAGDLLPGMNVDAKIEVESLQNVLSIPVGVVARNGQVLVKTKEPASPTNKADPKVPSGYAYKKLELGGSDDEYIEVLDGLQEGDIVTEVKEASASGFLFGGARGAAPGEGVSQSGAASQAGAPVPQNGGAGQ